MAARSVVDTMTAVATYEGAGMLVHRSFPTRGVDQVDPFLLLDEMGPAEHAPGEAHGFPDHPHRGFETVTYMLEGAVEHKDSAGNRGVIGPGGVQWMTAGAGVVHSEMPAGAIRRDGGRLHGFQLWVNLPTADKMTPPRYQELAADEIPVVAADGATVRVVAGSHAGTAGPIETHTPITYLHATVQPGRTLTQPVPAAHSVFAYVVAGSGRFGRDRTAAGGHDLVRFAPDGDEVTVTADAGPDPLDVLVVAGAPLHEPVARYGPFVMNTRAELVTAVEDYQAGRMGVISG